LGFGREAWRGRDIGLGRQPACAGRGSRSVQSGSPAVEPAAWAQRHRARGGRAWARARHAGAEAGARLLLRARDREKREREIRGEREE
jgi:hypothetical protein